MPRELATSGTAAVQLRVSGASFADIATTLGLSKPRDAVRLVNCEKSNIFFILNKSI